MQDDTTINPSALIEMKANVGSILFLWLSVEREITQRTNQLGNGKGRNRAGSTDVNRFWRRTSWRRRPAIFCRGN